MRINVPFVTLAMGATSPLLGHGLANAAPLSNDATPPASPNLDTGDSHPDGGRPHDRRTLIGGLGLIGTEDGSSNHVVSGSARLPGNAKASLGLLDLGGSPSSQVAVKTKTRPQDHHSVKSTSAGTKKTQAHKPKTKVEAHFNAHGSPKGFGGSAKGGNGGHADGGSVDCSTKGLLALNALNLGHACNGGVGGSANGGAATGGHGGPTVRTRDDILRAPPQGYDASSESHSGSDSDGSNSIGSDYDEDRRGHSATTFLQDLNGHSVGIGYTGSHGRKQVVQSRSEKKTAPHYVPAVGSTVNMMMGDDTPANDEGKSSSARHEKHHHHYKPNSFDSAYEVANDVSDQAERPLKRAGSDPLGDSHDETISPDDSVVRSYSSDRNARYNPHFGGSIHHAFKGAESQFNHLAGPKARMIGGDDHNDEPYATETAPSSHPTGQLSASQEQTPAQQGNDSDSDSDASSTKYDRADSHHHHRFLPDLKHIPFDRSGKLPDLKHISFDRSGKIIDHAVGRKPLPKRNSKGSIDGRNDLFALNPVDTSKRQDDDGSYANELAPIAGSEGEEHPAAVSEP